MPNQKKKLKKDLQILVSIICTIDLNLKGTK